MDATTVDLIKAGVLSVTDVDPVSGVVTVGFDKRDAFQGVPADFYGINKTVGGYVWRFNQVTNTLELVDEPMKYTNQTAAKPLEPEKPKTYNRIAMLG